jgi:CRISPR-associated protein (TIGR03985 family)
MFELIGEEVNPIPVFSDRPHIPLLQWLARGSLKQNLLRAIRLWVWLCALYGEEEKLSLGEPFSYASWRDTFFHSSHPKGEEIPPLHSRNCACAKTTREWLFNAQTGVSEIEWKRSLLAHDDIADLDQLLQRRLFGVTRRSLLADLQILTSLGWLKRQRQAYYRIYKFPDHPRQKIKISSYSANFLHPELANIAQNLSSSDTNIERFKLHVDYVIPDRALDRVDDWQYRLKHLWAQNPSPPVKLTYKSARLGYLVNCIVYPVRVYYVQRAVYLSAFGQTPNKAEDWYNYRLDRIEQMEVLSWTDPNLPSILRENYPDNLPHPDYIEEQMAIAWGFDFYLPRQLMLLRFDREFNERYIQGTFRHETFSPVSYDLAQELIKQQAQIPEKQQLLKLLKLRDRSDAYYRVYYRDGDTNVGLRLRSWRPKCEVIFPLKLRDEIAKEVAAEASLYLE